MPFRNHLASQRSLITPYEETRAGFISLALEKNRKATPFVEEAKAGDIAFFDDEEGNIVHVGMCLGKGEIIHASGRVRIDKFDHQGIFDNEKKRYSHRLRVIKRVVE